MPSSTKAFLENVFFFILQILWFFFYFAERKIVIPLENENLTWFFQRNSFLST